MDQLDPSAIESVYEKKIEAKARIIRA